jgi:hypothetical protein
VINGHRKLEGFDDRRFARGRPWEGFSDRVMGGVSGLSARVVVEGDLRCLSMAGRVSTRNNGGFIQVRVAMGTDFSPLD